MKSTSFLSRLKRRFRLRSIRSRLLVAFILLVLLPAVAVSISSAVMGYRSGKKQIYNQLDSVLTLKEAELRTWVENLRSDLAFAASGGDTRDWIEELIKASAETSSMSTGEQRSFDYAYLMLRERFLRITELSNRPRLQELFLISRDGKVVLSTDSWNEHLDLSQNYFFLQGLRRPGVHVEEVPNMAAKSTVWSVMVVEPVFDANGTVQGVLAGRAGVSRLNEIMIQRSGLGETGETFLLAPSGVLLTEARFKGYAKGQVRFKNYERLFSLLADKGRAMYEDYRGVPVIGGYRRLDDLEMLLLAEMDQSEAFRPISATLQFNMLVALVSVLLAVFVSALYTRGLASRIYKLSATAKAIAGGDLGRTAPVSGELEIRNLAAAFNAMTAWLHRRIETENLVAGISRELLHTSPANGHDLVYKALARVGRHLGVERIEAFQLQPDGENVESVIEWQEEGLNSRREILKNVNVKQLPWFSETIRRHGIVHLPRVCELPQQAQLEREFWSGLGIKSMVVAPMQPGGKLGGFLSLETVWGERRFAEEELALAELAADIVGSALARVATLQALQHSEERYALAQRAASIGSWEWDMTSSRLYCSDAFEPILGFVPGGFDGHVRTFMRMVHADDRSKVLDAIREAIQLGKVYAVEHRLVRNDGVVRWIFQAGAVYRAESGRPKRMLGIVRDITERKGAEEDLEAMNRRLEDLVDERTRDLEHKARELESANERLLELDKLKSAFLASVSHELRTPLTSILGFAKLIRRDLDKYFEKVPNAPLTRERERSRNNLEIILVECERLSRLINDVLDLTKIESGKVEWRDREADLKACITSALEAVGGDFETRPEVSLETEVDPDLPSLFIDPDRLCQVLINLLNNALKFTEQGVVKLTARYLQEAQRGEVLRIEVSDTGAGIDEADLEKIFDKFHQANQYDTLQGKPQGTGLGLAISRQIVENYHGKIWAESPSGEGSTFIVELPRTHVADQDARRA